MLRRLVASWLDRKPARRAAPPRSKDRVPVLFGPERALVSGRRGGRRLHLGDLELAIDGEIDWTLGSPGLHAMEYLACLDDAEVVSLVDAWIAEAGEASDPRALAIRCAVWMQQVSARSLPRDFVARASSSIAEQVPSLEHATPSIDCAKALIFAGRFFTSRVAERWTVLGRERLAVAVDEAVLDDGVHVDRQSARHLRAFSELLECRAAVEDEVLRGRLASLLDRMAQATADLYPCDLALECARVHASQGGRTASPRPAFAFESAGRFGLRGDESLLLVGDERTFAWSLGGHELILGDEPWSAPRGRVRHLRSDEGSLELGISREGRSWSLRATPDRIEIEEEVVEHGAGPVRTRMLLHPEVEIDLAPDARSVELRRKGIRVIVDSPSPMRIVQRSNASEIVVHHGIAPCMGEVTLRHVPAQRGETPRLDELAGLARSAASAEEVASPAAEIL